MQGVVQIERRSPAEVPLAQAVARLIAQAEAVFDTDRAAARECLHRASILLRVEGTCPRRPAAPSSTAVQPALAPWQLRRVVDHIESHLDEAISARALCALARLSTSHFFRAFKASTGMSPHTYVTTKRIERACVLLATTDEPLSQVAIACGLCDQSHLCRVFRKHLGVSPQTWRRAHYSGPAGTVPSLRNEPLRLHAAAGALCA